MWGRERKQLLLWKGPTIESLGSLTACTVWISALGLPTEPDRRDAQTLKLFEGVLARNEGIVYRVSLQRQRALCSDGLKETLLGLSRAGKRGRWQSLGQREDVGISG